MLASPIRRRLKQSLVLLSISYDALCAHLCKWITRFDSAQIDGAQIDSAQTNAQPERYIAIAINYRSRTQLSNSALGNFIQTIQVLASKGAEPYQLAQTIRHAVDNFKDQHLNYFSTCEYIKQNGGAKKISRFVNKGIDPINKTLLITNWSKFGVYDVAFFGNKPFYFTIFSDAPFPWLSSIVKGYSDQGFMYSAVLPLELIRKLTQADSLQSLHQYRDSEDVLPAGLAQLPWLL